MNPDAIRLALHGRAFIASAEGIVWEMARIFVRSLFLAGHSAVILDATNISDPRRVIWKPRSGRREFWRIKYRVFETKELECIDRAMADGREDLVAVIQRMGEYATYPDGPNAYTDDSIFED